jgi:hypothetical protein
MGPQQKSTLQIVTAKIRAILPNLDPHYSALFLMEIDQDPISYG